MQGELNLLSLLKGPELVRADILASFGDNEAAAVKFAVRWAWDHRRVRNMTQAFAASQIGIQPPHFANILNGKKYLPPQCLNAYEWIVGNRAVSLTIDRFRTMRQEQSALELARAIVAGGRR
jgi:hypothetical protein